MNRLPKLALAGAVAVAGAVPLVAQTAMQKPGSPDASRVVAGTYQADPHHTLVGWRVDHLGITPYFGQFSDITGTLQIDPKDIGATKVDIVVPVAKVTTASPGLTAHLLKPPAEPGGTPDFFGPAPQDARFVSTSVSRVRGKDKAKLTGNRQDAPGNA